MMPYICAFVWFFCLFLGGCFQTRLPEGVIATVNGEPIYLRTVQALLDGNTPVSAWETRSLKTLKSRYGEALGTLIVNALVRQELGRRKIAVNSDDLTKALAEIHADYGQEEAFSQILADKSLNEAEWQNLLRDHLSIRRFEQDILLPGIRIELPAIRAYYREHVADFRLPETIGVCFATAEQKEYLEIFTTAFPNGLEPIRTVARQCLDIVPQDLPPAWKNVLPGLVERTCAPPRKHGPMWETLCLKQRHAVGIASMADVYALIEQRLLEEEKSDAFRRWIETSLAAANIKVSPLIKDELLPPKGTDAAPVDEPTPSGHAVKNRESGPIAN